MFGYLRAHIARRRCVEKTAVAVSIEPRRVRILPRNTAKGVRREIAKTKYLAEIGGRKKISNPTTRIMSNSRG
jgi:hypothetical protein